MRLWFYINCAIVVACSTTNNGTVEPKINPYIVGGRPVSLQSYPSACIFFNIGAQCSGTILNSWTVLTAAHCFDQNKDKYQMVLELESRYLYDFQAKTYDVRKYVIHEDYNKTARFDSDIALIFVGQRISFSSKAKKAILVDHDKWMTENEKKFVVTGWGWTVYGGPVSDKGLMMAELQYISSKRCSEMHNTKITDGMFCLYGHGVKDTCKGDSGGGVLWQDMIVGLTSHGDGCGRINKPSVYTNVWYFREWINHQIDLFYRWYCALKLKKKISSQQE